MTKKEYQLGKRFIKRHWDSMSDAQKFQIANEIGGARHYNIFLKMMGCITMDVSEQEALTVELVQDEIQPLPFAKPGPIRGAGHNTVVDDYDRIREEEGEVWTQLLEVTDLLIPRIGAVVDVTRIERHLNIQMPLCREVILNWNKPLY